MLKVYVQNNSFKMAGKAKDIRAMLKKYQQFFPTVHEFIEKNNHSYMTISSTNDTVNHTHYYLLLPQKHK